MSAAVSGIVRPNGMPPSECAQRIESRERHDDRAVGHLTDRQTRVTMLEIDEPGGLA